MRARVLLAVLTVTAAPIIVSACAGDAVKPSSQPTFYNSLATPGAQVDAEAAASMISGYRGNNGLGPVTVDPQLNQLAAQQSKAMAARNKMDHNVNGTISERLRKGNYPARIVAENVGAGYYTLAEAFSGWRDSPGHKANMLNPGVTRIGIATEYAPNAKHKVFWTLILAAPG